MSPRWLPVGGHGRNSPDVAGAPPEVVGSIRGRSAVMQGIASADTRLLRLWLLAAGSVTAARVLNAAAPGHDMSLQILAAHNLLAGRGLSWYVHSGLDLTDPPGLVTLTHFPAGYSLAAAVLFSIGLDVGQVVKLLGAAATMVGWWGWGRLARPFLAEGIGRHAGWSRAAMVIAVMTPLFFTPSWDGTDLFLWATSPWVLHCLIRSADDRTRRGQALDCAAGLLCGLAFFTRYASAFLAVYAVVVILWQSRVGLILVRRLIVFGLGLLPLVAAQFWINAFVAGSDATPGGLNTVSALPSQRLFEGLTLLHNANFAWAFWLPGKVLSVLFPDVTAGPLPWQLALTAGAGGLLAIAAFGYASDTEAPSRDPRLLSLGLFVLIPGMLLLAMTLGAYDYVGDRRYYLPGVPLSVFVGYSVAAMRRVRRPAPLGALVRACGSLYVSGYVALTLVYALFLALPVHLGATQRTKVLGGDAAQWPSSAVVYELSPARELALRRFRERPGSLLLTARLASFTWDPTVDRSRVIGLSCDMRAQHVSGPARIVFMTFDIGRPEHLWYYTGNGITGTVDRADCFAGLSDIRLVQRFPEEGLKVLEAEVSADSEIALQ